MRLSGRLENILTVFLDETFGEHPVQLALGDNLSKASKNAGEAATIGQDRPKIKDRAQCESQRVQEDSAPHAE